MLEPCLHCVHVTINTFVNAITAVSILYIYPCNDGNHLWGQVEPPGVSAVSVDSLSIRASCGTKLGAPLIIG